MPPAADHARSPSTSNSDTDSVTVSATVKTRGVTGVEMEALTAASVAALSVYDMIKAVDKHAVLTDIKVLAKSGGKSGDWTTVSMRPNHTATAKPPGGRPASSSPPPGPPPAIYEDLTGPVIADWLTEHGFEPLPGAWWSPTASPSARPSGPS